MATSSPRFLRIEWSTKLENWIVLYEGRIKDESANLLALVQHWENMVDGKDMILETSDLASTLLGFMDEWDGKSMEN